MAEVVAKCRRRLQEANLFTVAGSLDQGDKRYKYFVMTIGAYSVVVGRQTKSFSTGVAVCSDDAGDVGCGKRTCVVEPAVVA